MSTPHPRRVVFTPVSPKGTGVVVSANGTDELAGGIGGWQVADQKHGRQSTAWTSQPARVYTIPVRIDGMGRTPHADTAVDHTVRRLRALGEIVRAKGKNHHPPIVSISGCARISTRQRWVMTTLTEDQVIRDATGHIIRYDCTIELTEYMRLHSTQSAAQKSAAKVGK